MKIKQATKEQAKMLRLVKGGADIWGYGEAITCRELEKMGLVKIVPAMNAPKDGAKRQPYFGCIAIAKKLKLTPPTV